MDVLINHMDAYHIDANRAVAPDTLQYLQADDPLRRQWRFPWGQPDDADDFKSREIVLYRDEPFGLIRIEPATVFAVQPQIDLDEEIQSGAVIDYPLVSRRESQTHQILFEEELLSTARLWVADQFPEMRCYCILPKSASAETGILARIGFRKITGVCMDTEFLARHGFATDGVGPDGYVIYEAPGLPDSIGQHQSKSAAGEEHFTWTNPLDLLTDDRSQLRVFSNPQTKVRLQPTLEFWEPIQLYTTYSAYPLIHVFLQRVLSDFNISDPRKLLVAPCGSGDFLRFWPKHQDGSYLEAVGLDIRSDFLELARLRTTTPNIDILNLILCETLSKVQKRHGLDEHLRDELRMLCLRVVSPEYRHRIDGFVEDHTLRLLARIFDQILQNRAIPDWYFPLKILAAMDGLENSIRADRLCGWLETKQDLIDLAVRDASALALDERGTDLRTTYGGTGLGSHCRFYYRDLTSKWTSEKEYEKEYYDLILCWEFIHVFHDRGSLGAFLDSMLERLAPGGAFVLTNIRENQEEVPAEQEEAQKHLTHARVKFDSHFLDFAGEYAPFKRRLHAKYPILIARK